MSFHYWSASGDAYRYTLQPVFRRLRRSYSCHVRRRRPETLYQLWFYVTVPGTSFETPRIHRRVEYQGRETTGSHVVTSFLTVEHTTGMRLDDELIMTGRGEKDRWIYSVRSAAVETSITSERYYNCCSFQIYFKHKANFLSFVFPY